MKINIIISTCNRCDSLKRTLQSIMKLDEPTCDYDVCVVDNNSSDDTKAVVQQMASESKGKFKYLFEAKQGKELALNSALTAVDGDVLAFTDDDITMDPQWLRHMDENFSDDEVVCVTGKIVPVYNKERPPWYSEQIASVLGHVDHSEERMEGEYVTGANMVYRRTILDEIGGFHYYEGLINEDTFLSHELRRRGRPIIYDPRMIVYHHFQEEKFNEGYFRRWYWLSGKTIAEVNKYPEKKMAKKFLGIPFWRYRMTLEHLGSWIANITVVDKRFYHEMQIRRFGGFCCQRWFGKKREGNEA